MTHGYIVADMVTGAMDGNYKTHADAIEAKRSLIARYPHLRWVVLEATEPDTYPGDGCFHVYRLNQGANHV